MLFGRYWLHAATERALTDRAGMEARLCSLVPWLYTYYGYTYYGYTYYGYTYYGYTYYGYTY